MKKKFLAAILAALCIFAFTACGSSVSIKDIQAAYTSAGYKAADAAEADNVKNSFGVTKGGTRVSVYEFSKEAYCDALIYIYQNSGSPLNAKFAKEDKIYVCLATNAISETESAAALKIFTALFETAV